MSEAVKGTLFWLGVVCFAIGFWVGVVLVGVLLW